MVKKGGVVFDFLESDWFNIALQILFLVLIVIDIKKYRQTKRQEYLLNIVVTIGFGIWALTPYYTSYFTWNDKEKERLLSGCETESNATLCKCIDKAIFKNYGYEEYTHLDKNGSAFADFLKEAKEECLDAGWF